MSTISTQLRNFKEPTKDQLTQIFFSIPFVGSLNEGSNQPSDEPERKEINAVLSLAIQGEEDSYVSHKSKSARHHRSVACITAHQAGKLYLIPPFLAFSSLDRKSVRFTIPLSTIRRVERLNARAGIYALSLLMWHGSKIVRADVLGRCDDAGAFSILDCTTHLFTPNSRFVLCTAS